MARIYKISEWLKEVGHGVESAKRISTYMKGLDGLEDDEVI